MWYMLRAFADVPVDINPLPGHGAKFASGSEVQTILSIVFTIIGAIALLIITIAGFSYITSAGDPQKAANAKNAIIYALVGLAVAISAEAIVTFVVVGKI
jgi:uncharacterized membrane protein YuzA (DUF378 family)